MQSRGMAASAVTILLALLILRARADEFTLSDALQSNGSRCGENGTLYPSKFSIPKDDWGFFGAPCSCDPLCAHYKDCCQNSEHFVAEDQVWGSSPQTCLSPSKRGRYFNMKKSCPVSWDDEGTRSKCQGDADFPLTSSRTDVTYSNMYCARCNGDFDPNTDSLWPTTYSCYGEDLFGYELQITSGENGTTDVNISVWNITDTDKFHYRYPINSFDFVHSYFLPEALTLYDPRSRPNFIKTEDEYEPTEHSTEPYDNPGNYTCEMFSPALNRNIMRICSQVIGTCASNWTDSDVEAMCLAYTDIYCNNTYLYRNPYCAYCNHINESQKFSCSVGAILYNADFSWVLKWDNTEYETSSSENDTSVEDMDNVDKRDVTLKYITIVGLCVSLGCLVLHLVISAATPRLRNLPAMNLASLCVALFLLYCSFLVRTVFDGLPCVELAVVIYYSMLATFCWMFVISFDVWNAIRSSTKKLQAFSGMKWKRFTVYSAFGWVGPVLIITSFFSLDTNFRPSYHLRNCWFSEARHVLGFVVAPLCIVMTLNVVFFSWSAYLVYSTKSKMENRSTARTHLCLFVRLVVVMGLTWITGLVARVLNVTVMWYVFVLLNTLQGLFIFVSFSCTKKVWIELTRRRTVSLQPTTSTTAASGI